MLKQNEENQKLNFIPLVIERDSSRYFMDQTDQDRSNWMSFIQAAESYAEKNCEVYEINGEIYYIANRDIRQKEQLKVGYSVAYATKYGLDVLEPSDTDEITTDRLPERISEENFNPSVMKSLVIPAIESLRVANLKEIMKFIEDNNTNLNMEMMKSNVQKYLHSAVKAGVLIIDGKNRYRKCV